MLFQLTAVWVGALLVASFLAIFWILRGSPSGQATAVEDDEDAPAPGYRDRVIAGVTAGLVLILLGGFLALTLTHGVRWSIPVFGLGIGLVLYLNIANRRYRHASPILRRTSELASMFLNAGLLAGILMVANVAAFRYGGRGIDLTREQTFSLSSLSTNQLESLNRPVTFHIVYGSGPRSARQLDRVVQLLELYRAVRLDLIKIDSLNPYTELARTEDLAKRAPDLAVMRGGGVLIEYGEGTDAEFVVVPARELFEPLSDASRVSTDRFESVFKGEDAITSALIRLRESRKSKVAFTTGHGEPSSSDLNPNSQGIGIWRARLASVGCEPIELNLYRDAIPDDLALLIIAGPKSPFKPDEVAKLKAYADQGRPVLALVGNTEPAGLDDFFKAFNLEIGRGLVIDLRLNFNRNVQLVFAPLKGNQGHAVIDSLQSDRAVLVPNGAPIHILGQGPSAPGKPGTAPVNANLVPIAILHSGPQSWAETDLTNPRPRFDQGIDEPGPVTVGVVVQERAAAASAGSTAKSGPRPRLVLFSSGSLADNVVQGIEPTNLDLVMNAVSWLRGRPDAVGITANTHVALTLTADPLLRSRLVLVPTVMAVLGIIAVGTIVYVARRE
ncbi:MAG TPA: GldG family protein [Isosphaeraceae bacterium]|nr:GldG family protein [Isosphaeraceae bacterium]